MWRENLEFADRVWIELRCGTSGPRIQETQTKIYVFAMSDYEVM